MTDNPKYSIRIATEFDLRAIKDLDARSFTSDQQYDDNFYASLWAGTRFQTYVATACEGTPVAYAVLDFGTEIARLRSMAVHPDYRGHAIGKALLKHVVATTSADVDLFVNATNTIAQRLYANEGFAIEATSTGSPGQFVMRLRRRIRLLLAIDAEFV